MKKTLIILITFTFANIVLAQSVIVKDSENYPLIQINDEGTTGSITLPSGGAPGALGPKLYNQGGTLMWGASPLGGGNDNLGNHIATQNIILNGNWLSNDGGSEGVFVAANGRVGIGMNSPTKELDIVGNVKITGAAGNSPLSIKPATDGDAVSIREADDGNDAILLLGYSGRGVLQLRENGVTKIGLDASSSNSYINAGNFGIGTTTPTSKLEVAGQVKITGGSPGSGKVLTSDATGLASWQSTAGGADNLGNHIATQNVRLNGNWLSGDGGSEGVFVSDIGDIGIGTNAPVAKLQIGSSLNPGTSASFTIQDDGAYNPAIHIGEDSNNKGRILWSNSSDQLYIETKVGGTLYDNTIVLNSGNVGIGVFNPGVKLEVNGQVKITGGSPGSGRVLTSDGSGLASWQVAPTDADWALSGNDVYGVLLTSGKLGVGISAPNVKTHIVQNTGEGYPTFGTGTILAVQQNSSGNWADIAITSSASGASALNFGDVNDFNVGSITYRNSNNSMALYTNASERVRIDSNGDVGIGITDPQRQLHVDEWIRISRVSPAVYWEIQTGNNWDLEFWCNGTHMSWINNVDGSFNISSDRRLKRDIVAISSVLPKVCQLKPSNFRFKSAPVDAPLSTGLIAQEVQELFPETVNEKNGYLSINYDAFGVIAIQAIKEQQKLIDDLTTRLEVLENR